MLEELNDAIVSFSFLKCHGGCERSSMTERRQMLGTSSKKARRRTWKYELISLTSVSGQIVNLKDMKMTGNRRWEKNLVGHLGSQDSDQQFEAKLAASHEWHTLGLNCHGKCSTTLSTTQPLWWNGPSASLEDTKLGAGWAADTLEDRPAT